MINTDPIKLKNKDLFDIDLFFKKQFTGKYRYGRMGLFFWKIFKNPFQLGFVNLFKDDDKIIATTSITPKSLLINQKEVLAAEIGDTYTDPNYQGKGFFSRLINSSRSNAYENDLKFVYGTPNNQSLPGYIKRANFDVIKSFDIRVLSLPIRVEAVFKSKFGWLLANVGDLLFNLFNRLYLFLTSIFINTNTRYVVEECDTIPEDWDEFWFFACKKWNFIFNKDSKSIFWRYFQNPEKYVFLTVRSSEKLIGFCVYRILHDESGTSLAIADYLFLEQHSSALNNCLKVIKSKALNLGVRSVFLWCDSTSPYYNLFRKNGFANRSHIPLISYKDVLFEELKEIDEIHFVMADSDNI
jgi:N-acetylglutamate synthase-like GNAT family acetyltransferase